MSNPTWSKAERLSVAGSVAPSVRSAAASRHKVTLIGKDGSPVGVSDTTEVAKSLLARVGIEFSVVPGKRPEYVTCTACGRAVKVKPTGSIPKICRDSATCAPAPKFERSGAGESLSPEALEAEHQKLAALASAKGLPASWVDMVMTARFGVSQQ